MRPSPPARSHVLGAMTFSMTSRSTFSMVLPYDLLVCQLELPPGCIVWLTTEPFCKPVVGVKGTGGAYFTLPLVDEMCRFRASVRLLVGSVACSSTGTMRSAME